MARWLVTGGAGFIGSHLVRRLIEKNQAVRVFDNFSYGKLENLAPLKNKIELVRGDLRDEGDVRKAVKNVEYILHQAALRSVYQSLQIPVEVNDVNVGGTVRLLWAALQARVKRVVYASSSSVYGESKIYPQSPDLKPMPVSPYAVSKLAAENYCRVFAKTMGLPTVSLRYFNVFGPGQDPASKYAVVIPIFMRSIIKGEPLPIHGDGKQSRDFTYIDNVVSANLLAATKRNVQGEVFNVACGTSNSLLDYVQILEKLCGRKLRARHEPPRSGDVRKTCADISKTKRMLGYRPLVGFEEGVRRTWAFFKAEKGTK